MGTAGIYVPVAMSNMSKRMGVTTWIKSTLLGNVQFKRRGCVGMGTPTAGLKLGRRVDAAFKEVCTTGVVTDQHGAAAGRRARAAACALTSRGVRLVGANKYVTRKGLRTHIDGLGVDPQGRTVVIELKSTQASFANHRAAYDTPCSNQPTIDVGSISLPNTERTHHAIQLWFGIIAGGYRGGYVVIATSDGAAVYGSAGCKVPPAIFDVTPRPLAPPPRAVTNTPQYTIRWPGARTAAPMWVDSGAHCRGIVVLVSSSGTRRAVAIAVRKQSSSARRALAIAAKHERCTVGIMAVPTKGKWVCHRVPVPYIGPKASKA